VKSIHCSLLPRVVIKVPLNLLSEKMNLFPPAAGSAYPLDFSECFPKLLLHPAPRSVIHVFKQALKWSSNVVASGSGITRFIISLSSSMSSVFHSCSSWHSCPIRCASASVPRLLQIVQRVVGISWYSIVT
jgi:hypothetical protein